MNSTCTKGGYLDTQFYRTMQMILEQIHRPDGRRCQFAKVSIEVTDLLCSYWNVSTGCKYTLVLSYPDN